MLCSGEAQIIFERYSDKGSKCWGQLCKRFNPLGEAYAFDKLTALMHQTRCKAMADLPAAIERWEHKVTKYEERSGETSPVFMKMPI